MIPNDRIPLAYTSSYTAYSSASIAFAESRLIAYRWNIDSILIASIVKLGIELIAFGGDIKGIENI